MQRDAARIGIRAPPPASSDALEPRHERVTAAGSGRRAPGGGIMPPRSLRTAFSHTRRPSRRRARSALSNASPRSSRAGCGSHAVAVEQRARRSGDAGAATRSRARRSAPARGLPRNTRREHAATAERRDAIRQHLTNRLALTLRSTQSRPARARAATCLDSVVARTAPGCPTSRRSPWCAGGEHVVGAHALPHHLVNRSRIAASMSCCACRSARVCTGPVRARCASRRSSGRAASCSP